MKISIALATYNGAQFILAQLESLHNQSLPPDEVIISDDCSTDGTADLIRNYISEWKLQNWRLLRNEENIGYIRNFRKALSLCTGDMILLCDQDDLWNKDKLRAMHGVMTEDGRITALASGYDMIDENNHRTQGLRRAFRERKMVPPEKPYRIGGRILCGNVAPGCTCAYRKKLVEEYLGREDAGGLPHDWALNFLAFEQKGLFFLNHHLTSYRITGKNTIGALSEEDTCRKRKSTLLELSENMQQVAMLSEEKQKYLQCAEFTAHRAKVAETGEIRLFLQGLSRYSPVLSPGRFLQYAKDYAVGRKLKKRGTAGKRKGDLQ